MKRRTFIKQSGLASPLLLAPKFSTWMPAEEITKLTILHTNDVHSRIDPFPMDGSRNAGLGGASKRASLIKELRDHLDNVLLLDSGDIFQGTPYFNFFGGELEIKLMEQMKYDVATMGNHDFDGGIDNFVTHMKHGSFEVVNSNYIVKDNSLSTVLKPYTIVEKGGIKIGIFGLGIELEGLVPKKLYGTTVYQDPIERGNSIAKQLKMDESCDLVICLSHLGYKYDDELVCDVVLAKNSRHIDIILGGHTHTFMKKPDLILNLDEEQVIINQAGWAGIMLGRLDLEFEKNTLNKCVTCKNLLIGT